MNIVIATGIFPPDIGGPATYSVTLAEEFSARGHKVTIVTYGNFKKEAQAMRYELHGISRTLPKGLRHLMYGMRVLQSGRHADVIYAQDPISAGVPACIAARLLRKKFVLKVVGDYAWEQGIQRFGVTDLLDDFLKKRYGFRVQILRFLEAFVARKARMIIVPSAYLKTVVHAWGVVNSHITVVYNAVHIEVRSSTTEEARKELYLEGTVLLSVGRLVPWKGFRMLIELLPELIKKRSDIRLVISGSGPEREQLEARAHNLQVQHHVLFLGAILHKQLMRYLTASDIFVLNTGYEGFSHQLLEVLAMPIPIITTLAGGNKEIIQDGENALVARYNNTEDWIDAITRLITDTDLYNKLSKPKSTILERYTKERMIEETLQVLSST